MAAKFSPHVERLVAVAASPSRKLLAIGGERDARGVAGSQLHVLALPKLAPHALINVDGAVLALAFANDELLVAATSQGELLGSDVSGETAKSLFASSIHRGAIRAVACDPMGQIVATVGDDGFVRVLRVGDGKVAACGEVELSPRPLRAVAIDGSGAVIAAAGDDGVIRSLALADLVAGKSDAAVREMRIGEGVGALCYSGDGRIIAGCADGGVRLCYLDGAEDTEDRAREAAHEAMVRGLAYGPELFDDANRALPRRLYSIGEDGELKAWQLDTKRRPKSISLGSARLRAMTWLAAAKSAKAERRGGTLVIVDWARRISLVLLNEKGEPDDSVDRVVSRLDELAADLKAKAENVRAAAVEALAGLAEDEARKLLDRALSSDKKPELRKLAAEVIGRGGRRLSRPALRAALNDSDKTVRRAALAALTTIESDTPLAAARAALVSEHSDMRRVALDRLPGLRATSPLVPTLIADALSDGNAKVRAAALAALFVLEGADSLIPARVAMQRGPADIRETALLLIGRSRKTGEPIAARLLEGALDDDHDKVRAMAFLVAIAARANLAARVRAVDARIKKALAEIEKEGALADAVAPAPLADDDLQPLFAAMACRYADTALVAARCLALLGDPRATGALLQLSRESDAAVRRGVVEALQVAAIAMPADDRLVARLEWLLDDSDDTVRHGAYDAIAKLGELDGASAELDLAALALRCSQHDIRVRALPVLVKFGGDGQYAKLGELAARADELLGDALDDEDGKVRGEAFRTLWAWHSKAPQKVLARAATSRQADVRKRVVGELVHHKPEKNQWADDLLIALVGDASEEVGIAAYKTLTKPKAGCQRDDVHLAALASPRPAVRATACKGAGSKTARALRDVLVALVADEKPAVHIAAIEAIDRLLPDEAEGFALAFGSVFYELRVRAMELCGRRRDQRAVEPAKAFLTIPETNVNRPDEAHRQRAARALADVGDSAAIPFCVALLDDDDPIVREMGARGLATACGPGHDKPLVDALAHPDLPVRSWVGEGLARLGDVRALPVLAGTLDHDHLPIRLGAIMGFVGLGPDGVRGILQGLDDQLREIQDLVFAVIVARDIALARASLAPDLLLSALSSSHPEIRFSAGRILEQRVAGESEAIGALARQLVGPREPDKAADMKEWPDADERQARLHIVVEALASDHPAHRYAAAQVLSLRPKPMAFWRESKRLTGPSSARRPRIPFTNWDDEKVQPRKRGWIRGLFARDEAAPVADASATERVLELVKLASAGRQISSGAGFDAGHARRLAFGTYAGLVRQAPVRGDSDETHRVRRDSIDRLAALATTDEVGREAVLPVLRRALSDPHHMVRRSAVAALRGLYPGGALEPLRLELQSTAADVGRGAVDELVAKAPDDEAAFALAVQTIDALVAEVRSYALSRLPRLFESGSLEPWLLALASEYADVRLSVVDRLVDSTDERVSIALGKAMESDHEDLRLKAAVALARRGDARTVDVLGGLLRSEESRVADAAREALVALAHARAAASDAAPAAARAVVARIEDDPDETADRRALLAALARIGSAAADELLVNLLADDDGDIRQRALETLLGIARDRDATPRPVDDGVTRQVYDEALVLGYARAAAASAHAPLRKRIAEVMRDIDDRASESILAELVEDRDEEVRVAACEALAFRARYVGDTAVGALSAALRGGRRELVLPTAAGLASQRRAEAFQPLLLVFKAGEQDERRRAILALGTLGDARALAELEPLVDSKTELEEEDRVLAPDVVEAFGRMLPNLEDAEVADRVRGIVENLAREGDAQMRQRALAGLRWAGDDRSRALLEGFAADRHEESNVRAWAVAELGRLANPTSEQVLADVIAEGDWQLAPQALAAVAKIFPDDKTRTNLLALRCPLAHVSAPAAGFLAWYGDADTLVERMSKVEDERVRRQLRQGLVRRGACPTARLATMLTGAEVAPRIDAAWIAGAASQVSLAGELETAVDLAGKDYQTAVAAAGPTGAAANEAAEAWRASLWAADRVGADVGKAALAVLSSMGTNRAPSVVRLAALGFLTNHGKDDAATTIEGCLADPAAEVRVAAAAALAKLAPAEAARVLERMTVADNAAMAPIVRIAVASDAGAMLATRVGRQLVLPPMLGDARVEELAQAAAAASGDDDKRLVAIASLGRLGGERAESALNALLASKNEDDKVRAAGFRALRRLQRRAERQRQLEEVSQ